MLTALSDFAADPLRNNLITQTVTGVGDFYVGLWNASSNGDWNSVAYSLGGATTNVAAIGGASYVGAGIAGAIAPEGISFSLSTAGRYALAGGGYYGGAITVSASAAQVATAGAIAGGTLMGSNVMFAEHTSNKSPSKRNKHEKGQTQRKREQFGGEKGDARRHNYRDYKIPKDKKNPKQ